MNKTRINRLEIKAQGIIQRSNKIPYVWSPEEGKIAIVATDWIIQRLTELGRDITYSPHDFFKAVYVDKGDKEVIDRIEGRYLYLKGINQPIKGISPIFEEPGYE